MKTRFKTVSKGLAIFLVLATLATAGAGFLEAGICWDAFLRCLDDPFAHVLFTGLISCLGGLSFCHKFIEPLI